MTALIQSRSEKSRRIQYDMRPLAAGTKAFRGGLAMVVTTGIAAGFYVEATAAQVGVIVGKFAEDADNTLGANGALTVNVNFFRERNLEGLVNDTVAPVTNLMRELPCFLLDDQSVTSTTNAAPCGLVYDVSPDGKTVWVEATQAPPGAQQIPFVQSGTSALVAGTKVVAGVVLTANSRILIQMKDPGAGAITGFGAFSTPAATRLPGAGTFVVNAVDDLKNLIATAVCTFDWFVIG